MAQVDLFFVCSLAYLLACFLTAPVSLDLELLTCGHFVVCVLRIRHSKMPVIRCKALCPRKILSFICIVRRRENFARFLDITG